jgi:hypothetical protein
MAGFLVEPRDLRRDEIARLTALGAAVTELTFAATREHLLRFARELVEPAQSELFFEALARAASAQRPFAYERWVRADAIARFDRVGCVRWLMEGAETARGIRFDRFPELPAMEIDLTTIQDAWAASWPGVLASFEAGRAVVITLDYEEIRCEVRAGRGTPYR